MAIRIAQVCGLWFWVAFTFFVIVVMHQSGTFSPVYSPSPAPAFSSSTALPKQSTAPKGGLTTSERVARSELAWKSSVALRHQMAIAHPQNPRIPLFPAQTLDDFGKTPYTVWDFFPATWTCPHDIQRVGRLGDGGKWVCGMSLYEGTKDVAVSGSRLANKPATIIYSFGVNDESTFEAEMLARIPTAQIYAFDFSVDRIGSQIPQAHLERVHFSKVGLGGVDEPTKTPPFWTLQSLMAQNKHSYIDILKIDIEGSEYQALDSFMDACDKTGGDMPIGQVMIELHLVDDQHVNFERFTKWWERLEAFGMRATWLEINLMAVTLGKGKTDPRCVEYVWVNAKDPKNILLLD